MNKKILVINGPNLNMLGLRDVQVYGSRTLNDINSEIEERAKSFSLDVEFFQSNSEGALIDKIQQSDADGIIINAGAYSHYSYAIRDALEIKKCVKVEVHLTDIFKREGFRRQSVVTEVCDTIYTGLKEEGYFKAVEFISERLR